MWAWARGGWVGGGRSPQPSVADPALGCGTLEDEAVEHRASDQSASTQKPI